jgi:hypothetical protein
VAAAKEQAEVLLTLYAKANTEIFTTQAVVQASLMLKGIFP